jgi:UDP-GlcNAc:undecaprenyl-phosphate GlcNAc-1-phosphate transferase
MGEDVRLLAGFILALGATAALTPAAIAIAARTAFFDHPAGYKQHAAPTPYLGGLALIFGLVIGSAALGTGFADLGPVVAAAVVLVAIGTVDDRIGLGIGLRIGIVLAIAAGLYYAGFGWAAFGSEIADLLLTAAFVLAVVNAYNLMDNQDGATPTVAAISAAAIGVYATVEGALLLGVLALALAGACAGFLPYNLAAPRARIFLGDGGSMPIGVTLAALMMSLPAMEGSGWYAIGVMVVLVGLPALDTTLVVYSRLHQGVGVLSGGRDHLTHRLLDRLGSCQRVAVALAGGQLALSGVAFWLLSLQPGVAVLGAGVTFLFGTIVILSLETPAWLTAALNSARPAPSAAVQDESPA